METIRCGSCGGSIGEDEFGECPLCGESIDGNEDRDELLLAHLSAAEEEIERLERQNARLRSRIAKLSKQNQSKKRAPRHRIRG